MKGRVAATIAWIVAGLIIAALTLWGALVLFYLAPGSSGVRETLAWGYGALGLVTLGALVMRRARRVAVPAFVVAFALVLIVWGSATPSNDRDWQPEVAVLPYADIDGDRVTVHNIRNFDYRTETDFTPAYYDRTFDLRRLDRVDLVAVYWMGPAIAHLFLTFGFGDDHLAISIEARKDRTKPLCDAPRLLPAVRAGLHRRRRARRHPGADQLPEVAAGRGLPVPGDRRRSRTAAASSSTTCATSTGCGSTPASTTRSRPTARP